MTDHSLDNALQGFVASSLTTPTGLQANAALNARRAIVLTANMAIWGALNYWFASILATGGLSALDVFLIVCFAIGTPWAVLGFCNAMIGLWLLGREGQGLRDVAPFLDAIARKDPVSLRTAVVMTLRNEDPARAVLRCKTVKESLDATGQGDAFSYFILSDTDQPGIATTEAALVKEWQASCVPARIVYRRRTQNEGYKAGNLHDFCRRWGAEFEVMVPLDADSLMTGDAILDLVRIMQVHPKIGMLQSLVVGMPSSSPFARMFQFGMRHGMRAYTMGQAWWTGDCGPYWGHNAAIRIKPFAEHCTLPVLPGAPPLGGPVLSHDQVEAVLMRRAGYEVRVMSTEQGSYEENPPDALAFMTRDVRWCQGNMQYIRLLGLPGLHPVSRFQLLWAILMFVGIPAWIFMIAALPIAASNAIAQPDFPVLSAQLLLIVFLLMHLSPKIAGMISTIATPGEVSRFGGAARYALSVGLEVIFSFLQGSISTVRTSLFILGIPIHKSIVWSTQRRESEGVSWRAAAKALWPQLLFGAVVCSALYTVAPMVLLWSLPLTAGYLLAIPFTVITASPGLGRFMRRNGVAGIPEDFVPPQEILAITQKEGVA